MLLPSGLCAFGFSYNNWGANPSTVPGTSVVPGASNAEGAWTQVASAANIAQDCYWLQVTVSNGATAAAAKNHLLDIGVDPAGGTAYAAIISNVCCGNSAQLSVGSTGASFLFPFFIKAGSSVAARVQGSNATAGTVIVSVKLWGQPSHPQNIPVGTIAQTFGTIASSNGTGFTPGNAADGAWVSMGTASTALWWWQVCVQIDNATILGHQTYIDIAAGDATNKKIITRLFITSSTSEAIGHSMSSNLAGMLAYSPVPAGTELWIRGRNSAAPATGYNATIIGIGGG